MRSELEEILKDYKKDGLLLSDKEAEDIEKLCCRKMEIAKVENKEEYMPLLFRDMVKEHFMRAAINEIFLLRTIERRVGNDVHGMQAVPLSFEMS